MSIEWPSRRKKNSRNSIRKKLTSVPTTPIANAPPTAAAPLSRFCAPLIAQVSICSMVCGHVRPEPAEHPTHQRQGFELLQDRRDSRQTGARAGTRSASVTCCANTTPKPTSGAMMQNGVSPVRMPAE